MPAQWFFSYREGRKGPVSAERLIQLIAQGKVDVAESAWCEGMAGWQPISTIPELAAASHTPPPVPAAPPSAASYGLIAFIEMATTN